MPIVLVRVDDRLIHGQILESWLPSTRAQELLVANDALADDQLQRMIMESAIPFSVSLVIDRVDRIASILTTSDSRDIRRIVLVENPVDALRLLRAGVQFDQLNLGNLGSHQPHKALSASVWVGEDSLDALQSILDEGVDVHLQSVPFEKPVHLCEVVDCRAEALYSAL
jgi:mannose/fructose/N-acetylgalactosamine-specific phosphotransferase system component IIB